MRQYAVKHRWLVLVFICTMSIQLKAQDSLRIDIHQAEQQFVQKNLLLLAEKYNIDIAKAQVIQARLYNNPSIQVTVPFYNAQDKKALDVSTRTGEYMAGIQQMILLAGKRNKQVKLAETNVEMAENDFFNLLRSLRYALRSDFYQLYYLNRSLNAYQIQLNYLGKLNTAYQELLQKGIVTLKDAVRIKSLYYSLQSERSSLLNQASDLNAELQLFLQDNRSIIVPLADEKTTADLTRYPLSTLLDSAYANRADLKRAKSTILYNEQNLSLQKALATPDLTLGAQFDKRGSYVNNANFFTMAMDLPFFHRNQGNIRAAKISIDQSKLFLQQQQSTVENEVQKAYVKWLNSEKLLSSFDPGFRNDLDHLLEGVTENFRKKNISLLEFVDFYESYKNNALQFNQLLQNRQQAIEDLYFAMGTTLIN